MDSTTTLNNELLNVYTRERFFEPCERMDTPFLDEMAEADDTKPSGRGRTFRLVLATPRAVGNPPEGGDWPTSRNRITRQATVNSAQIAAVVEITMKYEEGADAEGSFSGDAVHDAITEATDNLNSYRQALLSCGFGTGRLALVKASTTASTSFVCDTPFRAFQLRENQPIDIVDGAGVVQATAVIDSIDFATATVTTDTAMTLTAGWGVYQRDVVGNPMPNGLFNIVDDGDYATTIFGLSRTASGNKKLSAQTSKNGGVLRDYDEHVVRGFITQIVTMGGKIPTVIRCNHGIMGEHYRATVPDRVYVVGEMGKLPDYKTGANYKNLTFQYGEQVIPFKGDYDFPARTLMTIYMPGMRKHTLRKMDWVKSNGQILQLAPALGGGTYSYSHQASIMVDETISSRRLDLNGRMDNFRDREMGGDS